ncbi:NRDE family protein [uncultured Tenacibaculum sp.]|uniref:NRDE family protein n=1 Tax=uncultured Tenacibaculum sp. TaxID=174713 RepID=UPI002612D901|nr:NRDE family protein [uncultured Tenacibaculum sp.]
MCTVTYLPLGNNDFMLTSNRDEDPKRKTTEPKKYIEEEVELFYPKDSLAGGTWIGLSDKNRLVCLLNGGFENHTKKTKYRHSRGIIVKQLLTSDDAVKYVEDLDLTDIEPFTIVLVDWNNLLAAYELVWTGEEKAFKKLSQEPHVWSSSTLYTEEMKQLRRDWFSNWLNEREKFTQESVLAFHLDDSKDPEVSPKMKRFFVETVSVTSVVKKEESVTMDYHDLVTEKSEEKV